MTRQRLLTALAILAWAVVPSRTLNAQVPRYVAFGDSITEGVGDLRTQPGYPPALERYLRREGLDAEVINAGLAGEDTMEGLSRINAVLALGGDKLLLMEGTNDVTFVAEGLISLETVTDNLDEMARRGQQRGFEVVHATIVPRSQTARVDRNNIISINLTWAIRELAIDTNRGLADVWEIYDVSNNPDSFQTLFAPIPGDPIGHPNAAGYDLIAEVFGDVLLGRDTVPPLFGSFEPFFRLSTIPPDADFSAVLYEPREASGIDLDETFLLINGRIVAGVSPNRSNRRRAELRHTGPEGVGCRAELSIRSQDRNDPANVIERVLKLFDVQGRKILPGDVDFDCYIDGNDLTILARYFGAEAGEDRYFQRYDLNRDGIIDGRDLALMARNFGRDSA